MSQGLKKASNILLSACCFLVIFVLSGCIIRTYSVVKDRVDQDLQGNKGYIQGRSPSTEETIARKKTRQIEVVEIELRSPVEIKELPESKEDKDLSGGNRGYISDQQQTSPEIQAEAVSPEITPVIETYKVQKGDTLEKIAAKKEVYGDYKKWRKIYEANKDKLKGPNKIYPGQVLKIPHN